MGRKKSNVIVKKKESEIIWDELSPDQRDRLRHKYAENAGRPMDYYAEVYCSALIDCFGKENLTTDFELVTSNIQHYEKDTIQR